MIRGHKHLHECAFIGDDSSEELEELVEVAQERGLLQRPNETVSFNFFRFTILYVVWYIESNDVCDVFLSFKENRRVNRSIRMAFALILRL